MPKSGNVEAFFLPPTRPQNPSVDDGTNCTGKGSDAVLIRLSNNLVPRLSKLGSTIFGFTAGYREEDERCGLKTGFESDAMV